MAARDSDSGERFPSQSWKGRGPATKQGPKICWKCKLQLQGTAPPPTVRRTGSLLGPPPPTLPQGKLDIFGGHKWWGPGTTSHTPQCTGWSCPRERSTHNGNSAEARKSCLGAPVPQFSPCLSRAHSRGNGSLTTETSSRARERNWWV